MTGSYGVTVGGVAGGFYGLSVDGTTSAVVSSFVGLIVRDEQLKATFRTLAGRIASIASDCTKRADAVLAQTP